MTLKRTLVWGVVGGILTGLAMFALEASFDTRTPPYLQVSYFDHLCGLVNCPVYLIMDRMHFPNDMRGFYGTVVVFVVYWASIAVVVAVFVWLARRWRVSRRRTNVA